MTQTTDDAIDAQAADVEDDPTPVDPTDPPANERVLLQTHIVRVMDSPTTVEGETSSTGKTILVEKPYTDGQRRLDAETIFRGDAEYRGSRAYELYTPENFRRVQKSNLAPGPQAGANRVSDAEDLPAPSHVLATDEAEDV